MLATLPDNGMAGFPRMSGSKGTRDGLWKEGRVLQSCSAFLLALSDAAEGQLTLSQVAFFVTAAATAAKGKPATRTEILAASDERLSAAIRNNYRQLLEPGRQYPKGLGWLKRCDNDADDREKLLDLTARGRDVLEVALREAEFFTSAS